MKRSEKDNEILSLALEKKLLKKSYAYTAKENKVEVEKKIASVNKSMKDIRNEYKNGGEEK